MELRWKRSPYSFLTTKTEKLQESFTILHLHRVFQTAAAVPEEVQPADMDIGLPIGTMKISCTQAQLGQATGLAFA